jgi:hypothetical protein
MVSFIIKGKHDFISREEIRAMLQATSCIIEYHRIKPISDKPTVTVTITNDRNAFKDDYIGYAWDNDGKILLASWRNFQETFTICIHEVIHLYFDFKIYTEKLTSTLTCKLKPSIAKVYDVLIDNVYQRAGFIAHTKIAYLPKGRKDFYDDSQYKKVDVNNKGKQYRKKEVNIFADLFVKE